MERRKKRGPVVCDDEAFRELKLLWALLLLLLLCTPG